MIGEQQFPFLAEKGHVVSLVGGGGKTTLLYAMASHCAQKGWRVLVSTTTHILRRLITFKNRKTDSGQRLTPKYRNSGPAALMPWWALRLPRVS